MSKHRNTENLSELGKQIIENCPNAYINEYGQVIDPCCFWSSVINDPTNWNIEDYNANSKIPHTY